MKKLLIIFVLLLGLIGCTTTTPVDNGNDNDHDKEVKDETPPLILNVTNNQLPKVRHLRGEEVDLLANISVVDNVSKNVTLSIVDDGGYNKDTAGQYQITIEAKDEAGNTSIAYRVVEVFYTVKTTYANALVISGNAIEFELNSSTALEVASGVAKFRNLDKVQIMEKDFFLSEVERTKGSYADNGGIPYLTSGVVALLDSNLKVVHLRIAPNYEIDQNNKVNNKVTWSNAKVATGGGNFKGIIEVINQLLPKDGYVVFAPSYSKNNAKNFLIKNLFYTDYDGTNLSIDNRNVNIKNVNIKFEKNYEVELEMIEGEIKGSIVKTKYIYDGIPLTTYYKFDGKPKKLLFFFHGFAGDRETGIMDRGNTLAEQGFYVVAIDAYLHGERQPEFFKNLSYGDKQKEIVNIVMRTAEDAQRLYHKYFKKLDMLENPEKVYAYGVSMGGAVCFYLATIMEELKTIVTLVGSPSFVDFYEYKQQQYNWIQDEYYYTNLESYREKDPLINYHLLQNKNIFMGVGTQDTTVPLKYAKALKEKLPSPNVVYKEYNTAHSSTPEMLADSYNFIKNH